MEVFPYGWHTYEENGSIGIRIFGLNQENENVFVLVTGFTPYIYLELPDHVPWTSHRVQALSNKLDTLVERGRPIQKIFQRKKKLYYAKKDKTDAGYVDKTYPFLKCFFGCHSDIRPFMYKATRPIYVGDMGSIKLNAHENDANPILQFMCMKNIKPASWFTFQGGKKITKDDDKLSDCTHEYEVPYQRITPLEKNTVSAPLIMGFDIEVNSSNPNIAPRHGVREDKVFQISCVFCRNGQLESSYQKVILTLNKNKKGEEFELKQDMVGDDTEIRLFPTEAELLEGFTDIVNERQPNIITGYNIFSFDLPYMYARAKLTGSVTTFDQLSFIRGEHCKEKEIKWSSSAFKNQNFTYIDAPGRLWVDMLPIIQRDYKLENYKLKTVSDYFLGQTKDPLSVKGIFKCYRMFTPESLSIVAKYCVKDSELVVKLFEKLQVWIGLTEMANTCNTPVFTLFTQGQQIKIFSQVYKKCLADDYVIDKDSFVVNENDHFTGAYVFTPEPGLYDMVVSFDFSSLYPSTIIAYNIDYSTLVLDETIPDDKCHIFDWDDHCGCNCGKDLAIRKTKPKNIVCGHQRFRFMKEPAGVIPTLLKNLLDARKRTNAEMKRLKSTLSTLSSDEKALAERLITVLDKRQLSYKVSANSMYGGMGVKKGYLPFLPGAMCTTARGRESIEKASKFLVENLGGKLIYGDTDSCYITFPKYTTEADAKDLDLYCRQVEEEMTSLFPRPMKFAYEEAIYWRYMILSKKRYMALKCDTSGAISSKIEKRGVLLSRRDNSAYSRDFYSKVIMSAFYKEPVEKVLLTMTDELNRLSNHSVTAKDLTISKSVGDIKDYKIRPMPDDNKKLEKRLKELELLDDRADLEAVRTIFKSYVDKNETEYDMLRLKYGLEHLIVQEYINKALPSQVQLAEKMRRRGTRVDPGERIGYCVIESDHNIKDKLFNKIEDIDYYKEHSTVLTIDALYYSRLMINPIDEVLSAVYKKEDLFKKYYKIRETYWKVVKQLNDLFRPKITLIE